MIDLNLGLTPQAKCMSPLRGLIDGGLSYFRGSRPRLTVCRASGAHITDPPSRSYFPGVSRGIAGGALITDHLRGAAAAAGW
jgi:hypothetical protein